MWGNGQRRGPRYDARGASATMMDGTSGKYTDCGVSLERERPSGAWKHGASVRPGGREESEWALGEAGRVVVEGCVVYR